MGAPAVGVDGVGGIKAEVRWQVPRPPHRSRRLRRISTLLYGPRAGTDGTVTRR
jgi:hypothetical protein